MELAFVFDVIHNGVDFCYFKHKLSYCHGLVEVFDNPNAEMSYADLIKIERQRGTKIKQNETPPKSENL